MTLLEQMGQAGVDRLYGLYLRNPGSMWVDRVENKRTVIAWEGGAYTLADREQGKVFEFLAANHLLPWSMERVGEVNPALHGASSHGKMELWRRTGIQPEES